MNNLFHHELPNDSQDPVLNFLHGAIRIAVKILALLMVLVIYWSIADVLLVLYDRLVTPPMWLLNVEDILQTFSAFMVVLIAIEIFINIRLYLGTSVLPVQLVLATALMAVARKVIVLDLKIVKADQIIGIALVTMALGLSYWLVTCKSRQG